jgi:hypothetical protein
LKISNFTIDDSSFEENWCSGEGNLIDIEDGSLDVKTTKFLGNRGFIAPIRISIDSDQRFPLSFAESVFSNNYGRSAGSVYFSHKQVPIEFKYCNFSGFRFDEVRGDLNDQQLFHRCRFEHREGTIHAERRLPGLFVFSAAFGLYLVMSLLSVAVARRLFRRKTAGSDLGR